MDNKETDKSQMNGSMKDMNQLHLEKITYLNWHDVEDLRLTKEQKNYLPDNVSNLALAGVIREAGFHVFTFGIYLGEKPIGFVMIGYDIPLDPEDDLNEKYWFTRDSYFIWRCYFSQSGKATASEYNFLRMSIKVFRLSR